VVEQREKKISVLSEIDPIQTWLNTPLGYYIDKPTFGNNIPELLFKNIDQARLKLHLIFDKLEEDLGQEIVNMINEISLLQTEDFDKLYLVIRYNNNNFAGTEIKK
jgi:hypothetical protein